MLIVGLIEISCIFGAVEAGMRMDVWMKVKFQNNFHFWHFVFTHHVKQRSCQEFMYEKLNVSFVNYHMSTFRIEMS